MISVKKVLKMARSKLKDNSEILFSDYDIINALSECIRYINNSFAMKNSDFLEKIHEYRVNEINAEIDKYNSALAEGETPKEYVNFATTGVSLPDDFISLVSVVRAKDGYHLSPISAVEKVHWNGYKIFANKLYCGVDVDLLYRAKIADVKFSDIQNGGTIDLPDIFLDSVVKITCMILNNTDTDILGEAVKGLMDNLVPNRRYSRIKQRMPFIV